MNSRWSHLFADPAWIGSRNSEEPQVRQTGLNILTLACGLGFPGVARASPWGVGGGPDALLCVTAAVWLSLVVFMLRLRRKRPEHEQPRGSQAAALIAANGEVRDGSDALAGDVVGDVDS